MANLNDHMGRPIVAVTGMGIITSLGVGTPTTGQRCRPALPASIL